MWSTLNPGYRHPMGKVKFKKQYQAVGFGDKPSGKSVEGRRIVALKAAETRRFNQMVQERKEPEEAENSWMARTPRFIAWCFSHMKFRWRMMQSEREHPLGRFSCE